MNTVYQVIMFVELLIEVTLRTRSVLNIGIRLLSDLPFCYRVHIFRDHVKQDKMLKRMGGEAVGPGPGTIEIAVRRDHIVEDGFAQLNGLGSKLKSCINVSFVNELGLSEAGLDYGGLFKEFLTNLAKSAFDPG